MLSFMCGNLDAFIWILVPRSHRVPHILQLWGFVYGSKYDDILALSRTEMPGICRWWMSFSSMRNSHKCSCNMPFSDLVNDLKSPSFCCTCDPLVHTGQFLYIGKALPHASFHFLSTYWMMWIRIEKSTGASLWSCIVQCEGKCRFSLLSTYWMLMD